MHAGVQGGDLFTVRDQHHALPKPGQTPDAAEPGDRKAFALQQRAQGGAAPELDMPAVLQRGEMSVPLAGNRQREIFQVAVIRRGNHQLTARVILNAQHLEEAPRPARASATDPPAACAGP